MKRVKIFLASSIEDLREDRLQVGDFIRQLNEIYLDSGVHFSLIKCEDYDNSIVSGGKQQEYDREIRESELVFFLFFRKVGDYTRHEFEVALEAFQARKKPRIITYFKTVSAPEEAAEEVSAFMQLLDGELKHYYNTYGHIDTLKLGMLMQIKLLQLDASQLKLENGQVLLGGKAVVQAENVPMLRGNQALQELTEKRRQLQQQLDQCRSAYLADPTPEKEAAFFGTSAELNRVSKELTQVEQETMALLTSVAEMTADGRVLTCRLKEALKQFDRGDYAAVRAILADEERENELRRAENRAAMAKNEIQGYVEEELLLIKTEKAQGINRQRAQRIRAGYEKVVALVEKHDLDKLPLYDYACFLYDQNDYPGAVAVAEKLQWHWSKPGAAIAEDHYATLLNLLGNLYSGTQRYTEAEVAYGKAVEIYTRLAARNPEAIEPKLAVILNNLGILHKENQRDTQAEVAYEKAVEIYTRLAERNPEAFEPNLAAILNNLGILFADTERYTEAEAAYDKTVEIRTRLAARNPEAFEPDLATSLNNLGNLYCYTQCDTDAEKVYGKAVEIYTRLAARNPEAFEPKLAAILNNLGNLYKNTQRDTEAEEVYGKALDIYTHLTERTPEAFEPDLAMIYYNLGNLYSDTRRYSEAEAVYRKAVEVYTRLAEWNPDVFETSLADTMWNMAALYQQWGDTEKLTSTLRQAQPLCEKLARKYPAHYRQRAEFIRRLLSQAE